MISWAVAALLAAPAPCGEAWPHWTRYLESFVSKDGRVIDRSSGDHSTSEGQAYALFFALVANDRPSFARLLAWTEQNLAGGDLSANLPAWNWGRRPNRSWGVLDANSASDADLWLGYALLEAGRLWKEPQWDGLARRILANVASREVTTIEGLGPMLLPGPRGFADARQVRLNPSYEPPQVLRRFASANVPGPWAEVLESTVRMLRETALEGAVADWVAFQPGHGFLPDAVHGRTGSYDAIRTYLWVGMMADDDPRKAELARSASGLLRLLEKNGALPERVDVRSLQTRGNAPVGFAAALLPLARTLGDARATARLDARVTAARKDGVYGTPPTYYDQNLVLFGRGFVESRFHFAADGALVPAWEARCAR